MSEHILAAAPPNFTQTGHSTDGRERTGLCRQRNIARLDGMPAMGKDWVRHRGAARPNGRLMLTPSSNVAILGFGARAHAFAALLAPRGCSLRAWDPLLSTSGADVQRAHIEAAGVDAYADLSAALRGARLVVLDTVSADVLPATLPDGQELLDLASATAVQIDAALLALGLPCVTGRWEAACAAAAVAAASSADIPADRTAMRRGELP
jgi:hypothetical protein